MAVPVVTPGGPLTKRGKEQQVFTATNGVDNWTTSGGTLSATGPAGATWIAPNVSGTYTVTATNADGSDIVTITVESVAVSVPSWEYSGSYGSEILQFIPVSGAIDREEIELQGYKYSIDMTANNRQKAQFIEFLAHHQAHFGKKKNFYFTHPDTGTEYLMYYDAQLKESWRAPNLVAYSTVMKQV